MDKQISIWISNHLNKFMAYLSVIFTWLSEYGIIVIATCIIFVLYYAIKYKKWNLTFSIGFLIFGVVWLLLDGVGLVPFSLKMLVKRVRPYHEIEGFEAMMNSINYHLPSGYSFPSGHTYTAFFFAITIALRYKKLGYATIPLAVMVGFSRIWLGAHYFSDVLVGALIGSAAAVGNYFLCKFIYKKLEEKGKTYAIR